MAQPLGVKPGGDKSMEFWLLIIGSVAGVVGALAAVAVFVLPTKDGRDDHQAKATRSAATVEAPSPSASTSFGATTETTATPASSVETRYLAALTPTAGLGFLQLKGNNLRLTCPTNQSDDTFHEVTYALPAPYASFMTGMAVTGAGDQDASAGLQVFIQHRQERSDREVQLGDPIVLRQGSSATVTRALGDAVQLTLRITCAASSQVIALTAPRITR